MSLLNLLYNFIFSLTIQFWIKFMLYAFGCIEPIYYRFKYAIKSEDKYVSRIYKEVEDHKNNLWF